jgi:hypothetical protein
LGLGIDSGFLLRALQDALNTVGHKGKISSAFTVASAATES